MNIKGRIKKAALELAHVNYRHFNWFVQWRLTGVCNLRCVYCPESHAKEHPKSHETADRIVQLKPKYVVLSGGEPTLYPHLVKDIKRIKSQTNALIRLTTNGTNLKAILDCLPYLDVVLISVDGTGEINKRHKGVDGRVILDNVAILSDKIREYGTTLITHTVVTQDGLEHIEEIAPAIAAISPDIMIFFNPVLPCSLPVSVASDDQKYEKFIDLVKKMKQKYRVYTLPHDHTWRRERVICRRQYFRTEISSEGHMHTCFPHKYIEYYANRAKTALQEKKYKELSTDIMSTTKHLFFRKYNPLCFFPCNCEEELEYMFHAITPDNQHEERDHFLSLFRNHLPLTDRDIEEAANFIRKKFDPKFKEDHLIPFQIKS